MNNHNPLNMTTIEIESFVDLETHLALLLSLIAYIHHDLIGCLERDGLPFGEP